MTAASKAKIVLGCPGAGPTCFTITLFASCSSWVRGVIRLECPLQAALAIRAKGRWWYQTAQTMRASLFATATAALLCT
jgi:hypothetical protein